MKRKEAMDKVKRAMLAMQRYPWEQGVASQAILALGDYELAFLMDTMGGLARLFIRMMLPSWEMIIQ